MSAKEEGSGRPWWRYLAYFSLVLGLIMVSLLIFALVFEERIGQYVVSKLREQLKTELKVEKVELSMVRYFPRAVLRLRGVELQGALGDTLIQTEALDLRTSVFSMLTGAYHFHSVELHKGFIQIQQDARGRLNYDISREAEGQAEDDLDLAIERIALDEVELRYRNPRLEQDFQLHFKEGNFSGLFGDSSYILRTQAKGECRALSLSGSMLLEHKKFKLEGEIDLDQWGELLKFEQFKLELEENSFKFKGAIQAQPLGWDLDLQGRGELLRLSKLLHLLPQAWSERLEGLENSTDIQCQIELKGEYSPHKSPDLSLNLSVDKGAKLSHPGLSGEIKNLAFGLELSNLNPEQRLKLSLKDFQGKLDGQDFEVSFSMDGWQNPLIDLGFNARLPLSKTYGLLGKQISEGKGFLVLQNCRLKGLYSQLTNPELIHQAQISGRILAEEAMLRLNGLDLSLNQGELQLEGNNLNLRQTKLAMGQSHFGLQAQWSNALPFLLGAKEVDLGFRMVLRHGELNLQEFWQLLGYSPENAPGLLPLAPWMSRLQGQCFLDLDGLKHGEFETKKLNGELRFEQGQLWLKELSGQSFGGEWLAQGQIGIKTAQGQGVLACRDVQWPEALKGLGNLGQAQMRAEQFRGGRLQGRFWVQAQWDSTGQIQPASLEILGDAELLRGQILNLPIFAALNQAFKVKDFEEFPFGSLQTQFHLRRQQLHIPLVLLQSTAFNLVGSALQDLESKGDYQLKIHSSPVLMNKLKQGRSSDFKPPLKARQKGQFNLYTQIQGSLAAEGKREFSLGERQSQNRLMRDLNEEAPRLRERLLGLWPQSEAFKAYLPLPQREEPFDWQDLPNYGGDEDIQNWD